MLSLLILTYFAFAFGSDEYNFNCKPRPGCDFSECNSTFYYNDTIDYHLTCAPNFKVKVQEVSLDGYVTEEKMKEAVAAMGREFEEKIAKKNRDHEIAMLKFELYLKNERLERKKEEAKLDLKFSALKTQITKINNEIAGLNPTTGVDCSKYPDSFEYNGKCFWLIIKYSGTKLRTYETTKSWCKAQGGVLGNVYSSEHYQMIEKAARSKIKGSAIFFWTDMTYNLKDKSVSLGNSEPAPYVRWFNSVYPRPIEGHIGIKIQYNKHPNDNHGYFNRARTEDSKGGLCEAVISENVELHRKIAKLNEKIEKILEDMERPTTIPPGPCSKYPDSFEYNDKCFWLIYDDSDRTNSYDVTKMWCQDKGGDIGNVYSVYHYKLVEKAARAKLEENNFYFWTAMTYKLETDEVLLSDEMPAPFIRWYSSRYPTNSVEDNAIKIQFDEDPMGHHGFYNRPRSEDSKGVLCEASSY